MTAKTATEANEQRTCLIPAMCDHAHAMAAAMEAFGVAAEVLDAPDECSSELGGKLTLGRECLPCTLVLGDVLRRAQAPGFDPARHALFLTTSNGPCRYGQYMALYRQVLDEHGLQELEVLGPSNENSYQGFGDNPTALRRLFWEGLVAVDLLQQVLYHTRPYELVAGQSDAAYAAAFEDALTALRAGGAGLTAALGAAAERFADVRVDRSEPRPVIGIVGEIYARLNSFANRELIRTLERLGGEATCASVMEWTYYTNYHYGELKGHVGQGRERLVMQVTDLYQRYRERRLRAPLRRLLYWPPEPSSAYLVEAMRPYGNPALECETVMTLGKAVQLARQGVAGIVNAMPFSCMAGIVAAGLANRVRADYDNIPWLDLSFDLQRTTNLQTRLEAFMYQAAHRHARRAAYRTADTVVA